MGKFEEVMEVNMEKMKDLSPEEKEKQMKEWMIGAKGICKEYCGKCPSYEGTGEIDFVFCAMGKSDKITEEKGCICGKCPITEEMGLRWGFYCTRGSSRELWAAEK
ncbi:unnamed protein product [marine sediment metagenome]|uniref:DUF2769 domain-containing protein n=1 Tax=marine sediment metagenome TaxID=412755 RepID=X0WI03_9ZZZZ